MSKARSKSNKVIFDETLMKVFIAAIRDRSAIWKGPKNNPHALAPLWREIEGMFFETPLRSLKYKWQTLKKQMKDTLKLNLDDASALLSFPYYDDMIFIKDILCDELNLSTDFNQILPNEVPVVASSSSVVSSTYENTASKMPSVSKLAITNSSSMQSTDEEFLNSLRPYVQEVKDDIEKLNLRVEMLELLYRSLYGVSP